VGACEHRELEIAKAEIEGATRLARKALRVALEIQAASRKPNFTAAVETSENVPKRLAAKEDAYHDKHRRKKAG
jgi:hypothetical protein